MRRLAAATLATAGLLLAGGCGGAGGRAAAIVGKLQVIGTSYLSRLRALEQPGDDKKAIAKFLTPTGRVVGMLAEARTALERGEAVGALGVLQQAQPLDAEAGAAARS